jgi:hypothetical protein
MDCTLNGSAWYDTDSETWMLGSEQSPVLCAALCRRVQTIPIGPTPSHYHLSGTNSIAVCLKYYRSPKYLPGACVVTYTVRIAVGAARRRAAAESSAKAPALRHMHVNVFARERHMRYFLRQVPVYNCIAAYYYH